MKKSSFLIFLVMFSLLFSVQNIHAETYEADIALLAGNVIYSCDFEATNPCVSGWFADIPWDVTNASSYSGTQSLTDSPAGFYSDSYDGSAKINLGLDTVNRPLLTFWHRYNLESYGDFGYVEVSTDGINWRTLYFVTGFSGVNWEEVKIDLSEYAYQNIWLRFRLVTNASVTYDGWYIDDVSVTENTATLSYPFFDDVEGSGDNWIPSTWGRTSASSAHSGLYSWTDSPNGNTALVYSSLVLSGTLNLSTSVNPQLSFWHRIPGGGSYNRVFISNNGGHNWTQLAEYGAAISTWTRQQIDLSSYTGLSNILIKFEVQPDCPPWWGCSIYEGWYIDDVMVANASADISVSPASKDFGNVNVGSQSPAQVFTVTNKGIADLVISTLSLTGTNASEFIKQNDTCSGQTLASFTSCTVEAVFSPTSAGSKGASLSIPSNDSDTPNLNVPLNGTGAAPCTDNDGDGYAIEGGDCGPIDCDDSNPAINPGAVEGPYGSSTCSDTLDNDCDGVTDSADSNCQAVDLIETSVSNPPATAVIESSFQVSDTVKNQGNIASGASTTRYYLSVDKRKDATDKRLTGSRAVPVLNAGATSRGRVNVTIPTTTPSGTYYLLACADDKNAVAEGNERNNCKASSTTVQVTP